MAQNLARKAFAFDTWSRGSSLLHALPARPKLVLTLVLLVVVGIWPLAWILFAAVLGCLLLARLPLAGVAARAALVVPFTLVFALITASTGHLPRAVALLWKSYLSALWVALLMATTPLEQVLEAARRLGAPRLVLEVMHFTWRYLGVIGAQAARMRTAALSRGAERSFEVSAASLATLFASSYARAERVHRAMAARGFGVHP